MSQFNRPSDHMNRSAAAPSAAAQAVDVGLRRYMMRIYNYMGGALAVSAVTAGLGASTGLYVAIAQTPLIWLLIFSPLGIALYFGARLPHMGVRTAQTVFWAFAALMGLSLSGVFLVYTGESIVQTFLITAIAFGSLSLYGYTTNRNLSGFGTFLFMGLVGVIVASIVNIFLQSSALQFAVSAIGVLVFAGLTAYDTQSIKSLYYASDSQAVAAKKSIMGALRLYLDFINLFILLLQVFGRR